MFVLRSRDANFRKRLTKPTSTSPWRVTDLDAEPCPTVLAGGIGSCFVSGHVVEFDGAPFVTDPSKPPYRVPSMAEIREIPWNGFTVVSTFAGAGGSSTGYRMAGFRVLLANEFVPIAQESYAANAAPDTVVDGRDIATVRGADILARTGLKIGELDVLDGSPPCQAFSSAGKRDKGWGTERVYEHGARQKNEDLFFEYVRLRDELMPRVFVAENVSGLVKGKAKGYFLEILERLKVGYRVEARLLDAQWLGVPQARQRVIFVGVREDLGLPPAFPSPLPYRYSVREALPHLGRVIHDTSGLYGVGDVTDRPAPTITTGMRAINSWHFKVEERIVGTGGRGAFGEVKVSSPGLPAATIGTSASAGNGRNPAGEIYVTAPGGEVRRRKFTIPELMRICAFPDDFMLKGSYAQQWERLGNSVPPLMMRAIAAAVRDEILVPDRARNGGRAPRSLGRSTTTRSPKGAGRSPRGAGRAGTSAEAAPPRRPRRPAPPSAP